jgi:HK97 family phage major capsid protein
MELRDLTNMYETGDRARTFSKAIYAAVVASKRNVSHADAMLAIPGLETFAKAAVVAHTTGNLDAVAAAGEARAWLSLLQRRTVLGRLTGALNAPPTVTVPTPATDPVPVWVAEGAPLPVGRLALDDPTMPTGRYGIIEVFSDRLLRAAPDRAINVIEAVSLRALTRAEDTLLLSDTAAGATTPAGLLAGLSAVGAGSPASIADLEELWTAVADGDPDRPFFIASPRGAMHLAALNADGVPVFPLVSAATGGAIAGVPVLLSRAAGSFLILVDAARLAVNDDGITIEPSRQATIQMADDPTNNAATATPTTMVSLFQTGAAAVKYTRHVSWVKLSADAVAFLELPIAGSPA